MAVKRTIAVVKRKVFVFIFLNFKLLFDDSKFSDKNSERKFKCTDGKISSTNGKKKPRAVK